jgi:small ligand-binding sensory domain FIST
MTSTHGVLPVFATGLGVHEDAETAASEAAAGAMDGLRNTCDLAFLFFSPHHVSCAGVIGEIVRRTLSPRLLLGCSTQAVISGGTELEAVAGVSVLAAHLPGVRLRAAWVEDMTGQGESEALSSLIGDTSDLRAILLLADPFSVPLVRLLPALCAARANRHDAPVIGGLASAGSEPGSNALILNDRVCDRGGIVAALFGPIRVDTLVSAAARPIGAPMRVSKARRNMILELDGEPALVRIARVIESLPEPQRDAAKGGLLLGRVVHTDRAYFGRGDYLIHTVVGVDRARGALAINAPIRRGELVCIHQRDAATAHEDLALLLDAQKLHGPPAGVLMVTSVHRGRRLFPVPNHDAAAILRAFRPPVGGEAVAKPGVPFGATDGAGVPLAGFFAAGEIGPLGDDSYAHEHTVCAALFRALDA